MKRSLLTAFIGTGLLSLSSVVLAVPYASQNCNRLKAKIKHPKGAQGIYFDEHCDTAYVLPPEKGRAEMSALATTSNINFCSSVNKIPTISENLVSSIAITSEKVVKMIKDYEPQSKELEQLRKLRDEQQVTVDALSEKYTALEENLAELKQQYRDAKQEYSDCLEINEEKDECETYASNVEIAKTSWLGLKNGEYQVVKDSHFDAKAELAKLSKAVQRATSDLVTNIQPLYDLQDRLFDLKDRMSTLYQEYAPLRAVTGQMTYSVEWSDLLNDYAKLNQNVGVQFVKVPVIDARVHASAYIDGHNKEASLPVLLDASIPGLGKMGVAAITGENSKIEPDYEVPPTLQSVALGLGNAAISGQMTLSAVGACPYFPQGLETSREELNSDELSAYLTVNAVYEFPIKARRKYKAKYHLARMMERIEKKSKRGGFFSSRSVHEVVENSKSSDWFDIKFDADDAEFNYSPEEQEKIRREVKADLIQRSLSHVAATTFSAGGAPPALSSLQPTGASVTGGYLLKTCGWNFYCRAGGFILKGISSIFGRSEAVSKFKRTNNVWVNENVDQVAILRRSTSLTFTAK